MSKISLVNKEILFVSLIILSACSSNYRTDRQKGFINIDEKIKVLADEHPISYLKLSTKGKSNNLKSLNLSVIDTKEMTKINIKYTAEDDITERDTIPLGKNNHPLQNPDLIGIYPQIEQCSALIPEGYGYSHLKSIIFQDTDDKIITLGLKVTDMKKAAKSKLIKKEWHTTYINIYGNRGRIKGQRAVKEYSYSIKFKITADKAIAF